MNKNTKKIIIIIMILFMMTGCTKYLKNAENGKWNDMKYWASFVLLDGFN